MRLTVIYAWPPENTEAVYKRFQALMRGDAPEEIKQEYAKLRVIVSEKLATNKLVMVVEGDEMPGHVWGAYWNDLGEAELIQPSYDLTNEEVLSKLSPSH